jgi:glycosidase
MDDYKLGHRELRSDIYLEEDATTLRFGNAALELAISKESGNWLALMDRRMGVRLAGDATMPGLLLRVGGQRARPKEVRNSRMADLVGEQVIGWQTRYMDHQVVHDARAVTLSVDMSEGDWYLTSHLTLLPGEPVLHREFTIRYDGEGEVLLRDVRLLVSKLSLGAEVETTIEAPGYPTRCHVPLSELPLGIWGGLDSRPLRDPERVQHSVDVPGSAPGLVGLHNKGLGLSLLVWIGSVTEFGLAEVERTSHAVNLIDWLFVADRFQRGHAVRAGTQHIAVQQGTWHQAMEWFQAQYERVGLVTPRERPTWAGEAVIYEVHIGTAPFLNDVFYAPYPEVEDLIRDLPRIADLGFNAIQLMPHWPFCGYTVVDYYDIDISYGAEQGVRDLIRVAHSLGLKVIFDVVLHGCVDQEIVRWDMETFGPRYDFIFSEWLERAPARSRYRDEHPEWFMRDEDGNIARVYTWAFDPANEAWQDFIVDMLKYYVQDLGVDGFRFDAPTWNCMPNWDRHLPYRASASYYGSHQLFVKVRQALRAISPEVLMYTEPSGPLYRLTMDLNYNYDEEWLWSSLVDIVSPRGYSGSRSWDGHRLTAREMAEWLEYRRLALPRGSVTVHHLDSHDTFWWGEKAQFRSEAFGPEAARALFAVCACLDGGLMNYVGGEKATEEFYRRMLQLRRTLPELRQGECDYLAVECDDEMVFAPLRCWQGWYTIPIINLANRETTCRLRLPLDRMGIQPDARYTLWDAWNRRMVLPDKPAGCYGTELGEVPITLPPFGVAIWVVRAQEERRLEQVAARR